MEDEEIPKHRRHLRPNRGKNPNARWIVEEVAKKKPAAKRRKTAAAKPKPEVLEGETRCSCAGAVSDDRPMAECETCATWQHVVCEVGVEDESALPEPYACRQCRGASDDEGVSGGSGESGRGSRAKRPAKANGVKDAASPEEASKEQLNPVRRSVAEAWQKIVAAVAAKAGVEPAPDAAKLAAALEAALFEQFGRGAKDPGHLYREQFRMLSFNLKDDKNRGLQREVVSGQLPPAQFVGMSSAELRPPEMRRLAREIKKESLQDTIIAEPEPPTERISVGTAEVNMEPTFIALDREEEANSAEEEEAMKEPLGPPPTAHSATPAAPAPAAEAGDQPVWEGTVRLGSKLAFNAAATRLKGPARDAWAALLAPGSAMNIEGAVPTERSTKYLAETAGSGDGHALAALVLSSPAAGKLDELYEYLTSRDRVGAVEHSSVSVKDVYIVPAAGAAAPVFLGLDAAEETQLARLRTAGGSERLLLVVLVLT